DRASEKTRYGFDYTHNAVISYVYELPMIPAFKDSFAKHIFGGWQTNGIVALRSGLPFTVSQGNTLNTAEAPVRPDCFVAGMLSSSSVHKWFDPDAFRVVTCAQPVNSATDAGKALNTYLTQFCYYGSAGQGILEGPGYKNVDFSLLKNIQLREKLRLQ